MKILLDTCTFLWIIRDSSKLSQLARTLYADPDNETYLSPVSAWEISVKHAIGKLPLGAPPNIIIPETRHRHDIATLPLDEDSATAVSRLPPLHADPFDRLLICQAITHGMTILTPDARINQYPVNVKW
ncbi:MAG: type II toxin-antitoxin system VapC family toxin [Rhodocyclaceae bacterium]|nr:type II toxin-antitoxin system VapC family toxin [Rhodocyclaceae bacterium]